MENTLTNQEIVTMAKLYNANNIRLLISYLDALKDYLSAVEYSGASPAHFSTPHSTFYWHEGEIRSFERIPLQARGARYTDRMTKRNQRHFFDWDKIPYQKGPALDTLISRLTVLLTGTFRTKEQSAYVKIEAKICKTRPDLISLLAWLGRNITVTADCNLLIPAYLQFPYIFSPQLSLLTQVRLSGFFPKVNLPWKLLRKYFVTWRKSQLSSTPHPPFVRVEKISSEQMPSLIMEAGHSSLRMEVVYQPGSDSCTAANSIRINYGTKEVCAQRAYRLHADLPKQLAHALYQFTGGNRTAVDNLAHLCYRIMAPEPTGPRATIIYSARYAEELREFFHTVFCLQNVNLSPLVKRPATSFNQLVTTPQLLALASEQLSGKALLLLEDTLISDAARHKAQSLVHGKPILIKDPIAPFQRFQNNIHLLIITKDRTRALQLAYTLKAHFLDLSGFEVSTGDISFPDWRQALQERNWILTNFLLYSLKVATCPNQKSAVPPMEDDITHFLNMCCAINESACCSGHEIFQAYYDYYQVRTGTPPTILCRPFVRRVQEYYAMEDRICYRKTRRAGDTNPRAYFCGLQLLPPPPSEKREAKPEESFYDYLRAMSFLGDKLDIPPFLNVRITKGDV